MALKDLDIAKDSVLGAIDVIEQAGVMGIGHHGNFSLVVLSMKLFGDWLRDRLDPKLRNQ